MDKFQSELLAQFKEHNRLMKELVKIERANFELAKDINKTKSDKDWVVVESSYANQLGTYCCVDASVIDVHANRSISETKEGEDNA